MIRWLIAAACLGLAGCAAASGYVPTSIASPSPSRVVSPVPSPSVIHTAQPAVKCHYQGAMPDPVCTPGAINSTVTQDTIRSTICMPGWTTTIRVDLATLKRQQMRDYGDVLPDGSLQKTSLYREDHRVPLEVGGNSDDPRNLWPEETQASYKKDNLEDYIKAQVCSGAMTLAEGQAIFLGDFVAYQAAHPETQ